jgi:sugar lactone lactonase YvrE
MTFDCVLDARAGTGECPTWSIPEQALYWVDIPGKALNRFDPRTGENRVLRMPSDIGSFALRASGGFVVALRDGIWLAGRDGELERRVAEAPYDPAHHRFNDGRADRWGRFWVGGMNENRDRPSARLWRLDPDFSLHEMVDGLTVSNGLAWSPGSQTMYHSDTNALTIWAWDFDGPSGTIRNRRVFAQFSDETHRPDGGAVDSTGHYWSAFFRGGKVVRFAPDGRVVAEYPTPCACPTMCAFGGPDLRTLYVTSASRLRPAEELARFPRSGGVFAMHVDTPGMPEPYFDG